MDCLQSSCAEIARFNACKSVNIKCYLIVLPSGRIRCVTNGKTRGSKIEQVIDRLWRLSHEKPISSKQLCAMKIAGEHIQNGYVNALNTRTSPIVKWLHDKQNFFIDFFILYGFNLKPEFKIKRMENFRAAMDNHSVIAKYAEDAAIFLEDVKAFKRKVYSRRRMAEDELNE